MKLKNDNGELIFSNDENSFTMSIAPNSDIYFTTSNENMIYSLSTFSKDYKVFRMEIIFEKLMSLIIGYFILSNDQPDSALLKDFVDIKNKIITIHCEGGPDNILKLIYREGNIIIYLTKDEKSNPNNINIVRIRWDQSEYKDYGIFFKEIYKELINLANQLALTEQHNNDSLASKIKK